MPWPKANPGETCYWCDRPATVRLPYYMGGHDHVYLPTCPLMDGCVADQMERQIATAEERLGLRSA